MSRLIRDREFAAWRNGHFQPLPPELQQRLACSSFLEEHPEPVIQQTNFLDRLFNVFKGKNKERKEQEKAWKKERKEEKRGKGRRRFWD
jgi:penicillin-binding protein 1A